MLFITLFLLFAITANVALGISVILTNRVRRVNQTYLVSAIFMLLWLLANLLILHSKTPEAAIISINIASAVAACIPTTFQLLRLSITYPKLTWKALLKKVSIQIIFNITISILCFLPSFTKSVQFQEVGSAPGLARPIYGPPFIFFLLYLIISICILGYNVFKNRKKLKGSQRLELEFLLFAGLSGLIVGVFLGTVVALIFKSSSFVPVANASSVLTVSAIVAYGVAMHKVLTITGLLRKVTAYALLTTYLSIVYYITWISLQGCLTFFAITSTLPGHLVSALVVAYSLLPARTRMQQAADRLFSNVAIFDVQTTMKKAGEIFQSVSTINALQNHFSNLLVEALGTSNVLILSKSDLGYEQSYPAIRNEGPIIYCNENAVVNMISKTREPVCRDSLVRIRETPKTRNATTCLKENNINIATGIFSKSGLNGIVLCEPRLSGRIYDKNEQDALQILCNQFAVALENAQMYTEMQDSKIRNEIMLDQLVSGVIVANPERKVSLINNEAQRITGLTEEQVIGQDITMLPKTITRALESTLSTRSSIRNVDAILFAQEETSTHVRMGSAYLIGHDDKPMGALLVFTDMTEMKSLEEQVRRSDQLSSVGTLAAGMAHEIKNPLVTIKTFTQLLPERHDDPDFRKDFSSLVAHEVARIDGIVNQLLSFSKPIQPHLVPMKLHDTVAQTLKLIHEQLSQKNITLKQDFRAKEDLISGDADLLTQTLVNLNLNAIDAIESDGCISVTTTNCSYRFANGDDPDRATNLSCIRLQISDTGKGIETDQLQKIFDPFFTSKSEGTGMGLSVAHGIIQEHRGVIEVQSEPGKGTTFNIYIPLLKEDAAA